MTLDEALKIGDRIAILNGGELVQHGTSQDILMTPADDYVRDFVKKVNRSHVLHAKSVMNDQKPENGVESKLLLMKKTLLIMFCAKYCVQMLIVRGSRF